MNHQKGIARIGKKEGSQTVDIFTIGHSNRDILTFISLLMTVNVQTVVDCRTKPRSRWVHFNAEQLAMHLDSMKINYEYRGHNLGGLAGNENFYETIVEMKARAESGERIALMCSEGEPDQCHRGTVLAPELEKIGVTVKHLLYAQKNQNNEQLSADW